MCRERGFDSKWVAADNKKQNSWQEVKVSSNKKTLSAAEKKAKTQKISEQVLKNADAVQVRSLFDQWVAICLTHIPVSAGSFGRRAAA